MENNVMIILMFGIFLFIIGCIQKTSSEDNLAMQIVNDYYVALNNKDYHTMYELISEGFKQIEPTAKTHESFNAYMSKFFDTAKGISIINTSITSASQNEIVVNYAAEITMLDNSIKELKSSFTVKKKPEGWRLIHPYGEKIDTN